MRIKHFLNLEWKQFFRSASFNKSIGLKIMMIFFALYFMGSFLVMGILLYPGLKKGFPDQDPFVIVNTYLFFYILGDILMCLKNQGYVGVGWFNQLYRPIFFKRRY